jgi:muramoyltetrapeptide carboxypeptidase
MLRIAVVAPGSRIDAGVAERVTELAAALYPGRIALSFHPQCFLSSGHFAGDDDARLAAFVEAANDSRIDVVWFARGGYGAVRLLPRVLDKMNESARRKTWLGYSDGGTLLGALYGRGIGRAVHGPMPCDIIRSGGETAVARALKFLSDGPADTLEPAVSPAVPAAAFNITILSHLIGTPWQPDLTGHVLMLEEVAEAMYRIDRDLAHITANPGIRAVAGIRLGRCSAIPPNDPDFAQNEEQVVRHWCAVSGIPYLGRADIGHDTANKLVPFGRLTPS